MQSTRASAQATAIPWGEASKLKASRSRWLVVLPAFLFVLLGGVTLVTKLPYLDEAYYGEPAFNLSRGAGMGTTVLETAGTKLRGLDRHTYWEMPLFIAVQAAAYRVVGFGLFRERSVAMLFGLLLLVSFYTMLRKLFADSPIPLLASTILACDFLFVSIMVVGRSDALCAGFGYAGLAAYLCLRERHFAAAVFSSQLLVVLSGLSHPNGILLLGMLLYMTFHLDRQRVRWKYVGVALIPYVVGALSWGAYILQAPQDFWAQFSWNASGRLTGFIAPAGAILGEIARYRSAYGFAPGASLVSHMQIIGLVAYMAGVTGTIVTGCLRRESGTGLLLGLTSLVVFLMVFFDGAKWDMHMVYVLPLYAALLARWAYDFGSRHASWKALMGAGIAGLLLFDVGVLGYLAHRNDYRNKYLPATRFLAAHLEPGEQVISTGEMGFELSFPRVNDDFRLGYYSGKRPQLILINPLYKGFQASLKKYHPDEYSHAVNLLATRYEKVYDDKFYQIYARR